jgi:hypothetical protein
MEGGNQSLLIFVFLFDPITDVNIDVGDFHPTSNTDYDNDHRND